MLHRAAPGLSRRSGPSAPAPRWAGSGRDSPSFRACPWPALFYGACFAVMGWLLGSLLRPAPSMMMALTCGFLLVGPFLAMGLYEIARQQARA